MLNAGIMEPTMKATAHPAYSCKPSNTKKIINRIKKIILFKVRLVTLAGLFFLSTSYQSHRKGLLRMENDLFLPAVTDSLISFFRQMHDSEGFVQDQYNLRTFPLVKEFYSGQNYRPVWTSNTMISDQAAVLLDLLNQAEMYGIESNLFRIQEIQHELNLLANPDLRGDHLKSRIDLELLLTDACLKFMVYLKMGYLEFDSSLFTLPGIANIPLCLSNALESNDFEKSILSVQPTFVEYVKLQKGLERFLKRTERTIEKVIIPDPSKDSALFRRVAEKVLIRLGYLEPKSAKTDFLSSLKRFQYYHGLEPDGKPGRNTCEALAQSTQDKFRQIALNLNRLRKESFQAEQFIFVNIPAYQVRIYKSNKIVGNSRAIVGSVKTPTPLVTSKIERVITNPVWEVPRSITLNEMLPKLKSDSGFLSRNRFRLVDENRNPVAYNQINWNTVSVKTFAMKLKQDAGSKNALGRVKFVFPNPYSVYLHDTPDKQSFSKDIRAFSHGCIRVQHPEKLAEYLVREFSQQPDETDVVSLINRGVRREITLDSPVDLYIRYLTCEADEDYNIFFYKDIYRFDETELKRAEFLQ
jgi:murein L,D-transpeptidase YcbB/YkuD